MISINTTSIISNDVLEKPSLTYGLDLDKGRIIGRIDGIEAVDLYIRKTLITPRFGCLIYSKNYGSWNRNIAKKLLPKLVKDALSDSRIIDVFDFVFEDGKNDVLLVNFKVNTIYGVTEVREAITIV